MALIKLTFVGFADQAEDAKPRRVGEAVMVNPDFIVSLDGWAQPSGTRLRIQHVERDVVVSETLDEIQNLIAG